MHPEKSPSSCSPQLVAAHSVSRSSNLSSIAENGHVLHFDSSLRSLLETGGRLAVQSIGINRASVFTGFCHKHDTTTFAPIDRPITSISEQEIFLTAYRAICRELFTKTAASAERLLSLARQLDRGKDENSQRIIQGFNDSRELGLTAGMRDLRAIKAEYDQVLLRGDYNNLSYYIVKLDHAPQIVCTAAFTPEVDFQGNQLQRLDEATTFADSITCSIVKTVDGTAIVLAWLSEKQRACSGLVESLEKLKIHQLSNAIVRLVFEHVENVFFSSSWWDSLDEQAKGAIEKHANSFHDKAIDCLRDDGSRLALWSVVGKTKVIRSL